MYVQNIELSRFCSQFREIANKFADNEKVIKNLTVVGNNLYEVLLNYPPLSAPRIIYIGW